MKYSPKKVAGMLVFLQRVSYVTMLLASLIGSAAIARSAIRSEYIHFQPGTNSTVVEGSITGTETIDYVLGAGKGQYLNVGMVTDNFANYFKILAPGENEVAFFDGLTNNNQYEGVLEKKGEYRIRVYQMRSAARRNEIANYNIEIIFSSPEDAKDSSQSSPAGNETDAQGIKNKVTSKIPCSAGAGPLTDSCSIRVTREGKGNGIITITRPDESTRTIFFENGKAVGADISQADPAEFSAKKDGDVVVIRVGDEHYKIPDAVISRE